MLGRYMYMLYLVYMNIQMFWISPTHYVNQTYNHTVQMCSSCLTETHPFCQIEVSFEFTQFLHVMSPRSVSSSLCGLSTVSVSFLYRLSLKSIKEPLQYVFSVIANILHVLPSASPCF